MSGGVLVVGAGPTGLVLALALARAGIAVRVIDRRPGPGRESRALDVQARTLEFYRQLGVVDQLLSRGTRIERVCVRADGREAAVIDVRGLGRGLSRYPFLLCCPQDDHEAVLVDALAEAGVAVEWQSELDEVREEGDEGVTVAVRGPEGAVRALRVDYVCGCDGAGSTVRQQLGVDFPGSTSEQTYFVADVDPDPPSSRTGSPAGTFTFCLSRDGFLVVVPARRTGATRIIGLLPAGLTAETATFEALRPDVERATGVGLGRLNWFSTYQVSHRVADRFRVGRVFLLGDAAHVHSPLGGQGMNTGIGDAVNLAWKLAAVLHSCAHPSLLDTYEPERRAFARSLVATTDRVFRLVAGPGPGRRRARRVLFRTLLPRLLRWPGTRTALIGQISQVRLNYRASPLSLGVAGSVRGGDRLPWVDFGDGGDNFAGLNSRDWQVHVYGSASVGLHSAAAQLGLTLHEFGWTRTAGRAGLRRDAYYLVRPDGYLAVVDAAQDVDPLRSLIGRSGIIPGPGRGA